MNTRRVLLIDLGIAAAFALVVVLIAPGLAAVAIIAFVVIAVLVISAVVGAVRARRKAGRPRRQ